MIVFKNGKTEIQLAEPSGFCYGVNAALKAVENAIEKYGHTKGRIFTFGPIIHNKTTIEELERKSVLAADDLGDIPQGGVVIIRTHGVPSQVENEMRTSDLIVEDATCPHVKKIHRLVETASDKKKVIMIVGNPTHPEVIGIKGRANVPVFVIQSAQDVQAVEVQATQACDSHTDDILVVAQTTISESMWDECTDAIIKKFPQAEMNRTICKATENRQVACAELAKISDLMIIIGDKNSSNSMKLYEISKKACHNTYFVERIEDLPLKEVSKCNRIGVSAGASTPVRIIKEVISAMSEEITKNYEEVNEMQDFMEEIERSLRLPGRGETVSGDVILVNDREVVVNLGCKKDGIIPKDEIALQPGQDLVSQFHEGDFVQAKVIKTDDGDGNILLSKKRLEVNEHWDEIITALDNKSFVNVKVIKEVKGGVIAAYKEVTGFIPMSQLSDRYTENADEFVGQVLLVRVTKVDQRRNKAVFSHKAYLYEQRAKKIAEVWSTLNIGDVVEGTVMRFTDYGAFVDIGGIDGLLHISEISWGKLKHPQEALEIGQKISVKVLSMNEEKGKISLGLKQNVPEPWSIINDKYVVGQTVEGKVVQIKEYGAFVELEPGLDGLVHISEIAFKRVANIGDEIAIGQTVKAKILEIDMDKKRISLSIKEALDADAAAAAQAEASLDEEVPADEAEAAVESDVQSDELTSVAVEEVPEIQEAVAL